MTRAKKIAFLAMISFSLLVPYARAQSSSVPSATQASLDTLHVLPANEQPSGALDRGENSQNAAAGETQSDPHTPPDAQPKKKKKLGGRGSFVVAPLPISSPAIGSGIIPVIGYIFPFSANDKISPPSTIGVAGLITNNGSRGFAIGGQLFLKQNTYEITSGFANGNIDYNIYGNGVTSNLKLPLAQTGRAFFGEVLRRIGWNFFLGPRFVTGRSFITVVPNNDTKFSDTAGSRDCHSEPNLLGGASQSGYSSESFLPAGRYVLHVYIGFFLAGSRQQIHVSVV